MQRPAPLLITLAITLVAGCGESPTADQPALSPEEAAALAPQYAEMGAATLDLVAFAGHLPATRPVPGTTTFSRTSPCPAGGTVTVAGTSTVAVEQSTRTVTVQLNATTTHAACAMQKRDGSRVTLTGAPNVVTNGTRKMVEGKPSGPQVTTQKGTLVITVGSASQSCAVDLTTTLDPAAGTHRVVGTYCGHPVDRTHPIRRS